MKLPNDKQLVLTQQLEAQAEELTQELFFKYFTAYSSAGSDEAIRVCYSTVRSLLLLGNAAPHDRLVGAVAEAHRLAGVEVTAEWAQGTGGVAQMLRLIERCIDRQLERLNDKSQSGVPFVRMASPAAAPERPAEEKPKGPTIGEVFAEYRQIRLKGSEQQKKYTPDSLNKYDLAVRMFIYQFGASTPIRALDNEALSRFVGVWGMLPSNYSDVIKQILAVDGPRPTLDELTYAVEEDAEIIKPSAVRRMLTGIKSCYTFMANRRSYGIIDRSKVLHVNVPDGDKAAREPYPKELIPQIFNPRFVEKCAGRAERYWLPIIMLHTGMRPNEIAQLYCDDIVFDQRSERHWIFCCDNEERGQRLKTETSFRAIPIHGWLLDAGLLDYRDSAASSSDARLFPRLWEGKANYRSEAVSRWFNPEVLRPLNDHPKITLYSGRHSFADALREDGVDGATIGSLLGHATGSIQTQRYGGKRTPAVVRTHVEVIDRLDWREALSGLPKWQSIRTNLID